MKRRHILDIPQFDHSPIQPVRQGHIGERVFVSDWQLLQQRKEYRDSPNNELLCEILRPMCHDDYPPTQRHASVAASFICWLGTNCGAAYLKRCQRIEASGKHTRNDAYLAGWAIENKRRRGVNSEYRLIELIIAPPDLFGTNFVTGFGLLREPDLTVADYETVECVAAWLGTDAGWKFILDAETEIEKQEAAKRRHERAIAEGRTTKVPG